VQLDPLWNLNKAADVVGPRVDLVPVPGLIDTLVGVTAVYEKAQGLRHRGAPRPFSAVSGANRVWSKRDRVDCLSRFILYEQGGISRTITILSQFSHNTMPMFPCGLMAGKMHAVRIVMCAVRGADHKVVTRHSISSRFFYNRTRYMCRLVWCSVCRACNSVSPAPLSFHLVLAFLSARWLSASLVSRRTPACFIVRDHGGQKFA
jgi:hypothetical protein